MEAARAIWNIIGEDHVQNFVVVGGAALLFHGVVLPIYDTDRAITGDSLNKFYEQAMHDARLTQTLPGAWEYHSSYGFHVEVDFLDILGQGGYMHELKDHCIIGGIPVATLTDLALGKGGAWKDRGRLKDLLGFEYAVCEMVSKGLDFRGLDTGEGDSGGHNGGTPESGKGEEVAQDHYNIVIEKGTRMECVNER